MREPNWRYYLIAIKNSSRFMIKFYFGIKDNISSFFSSLTKKPVLLINHLNTTPTTRISILVTFLQNVCPFFLSMSCAYSARVVDCMPYLYGLFLELVVIVAIITSLFLKACSVHHTNAYSPLTSLYWNNLPL